MNDFDSNLMENTHQDNEKRTIFDDYLTVWTFIPENDLEIRLNDLLVYSAIAYSAKYKRYPNNGQLAWRTGLNRTTIPSCIERLQGLGLLAERTPTDLDVFRKTQSGLAFWKCIVRTDSSPLTVAATAVFSFLWFHVAVNNWQPKHGWTAAYLATCLHLQRKTVMDSLETLQEQNLLRIDDCWMMPDALVGTQLDWFRKKEKREVASAGKTVKLFTPEVPKQDIPALEVIDVLNEHVREVQPNSLAVPPTISSEIISRLRQENLKCQWKPRALELYREIVAEQQCKEVAHV